jgi:hypothetical protein
MTTVDPVENAVHIMREQAAKLLEARIRMIRAESLLRQSNLYVGFIIKRWAELGVGSEPAAGLRADIEKFLEEAQS